MIDFDSHIEHFRPQSDPATDPLDFANMLCSCNPSEVGKRKPSHCGNLKDDWFDEDTLVSPLDTDCETRFSFTFDGRIKAAVNTDIAAAETIKKLGLDTPKLNSLRLSTIDFFLLESESATFQTLLDDHLSMNNQGRFGEFFITIQYLFK